MALDILETLKNTLAVLAVYHIGSLLFTYKDSLAGKVAALLTVLVVLLVVIVQIGRQYLKASTRENSAAKVTVLDINEDYTRNDVATERSADIVEQNMMEEEPQNAAIQLIYYEHGRFCISQSAMDTLKSITTSFGVVAVVGRFRTGKSYLLNRLSGQKSTFKIDHTSDKCTDGIWMWIKEDTQQALLLLDTEGLLDDSNSDETFDRKLFALSMLLSSCLVCNIVQIIDDTFLKQLRLAAYLARHVLEQTKSDMIDVSSGNGFPALITVIRDCSLTLTTGGSPCSPKEYLHDILTNKHDDLKAFFPERQCVALPYPTSDKRKLAKLEYVADELLDETFVYKAKALVDEIQHSVRVFPLMRESTSGVEYASLVTSYIDKLNTMNLRSVGSSLDLMEKELTVIATYDKHMKKECAKKPLPLNFLMNIHLDAMKKAKSVMCEHKEHQALLEDSLEMDIQGSFEQFKRQNTQLKVDIIKQELIRLQAYVQVEGRIYPEFLSLKERAVSNIITTYQNDDEMQELFRQHLTVFDEEEQILKTKRLEVYINYFGNGFVTISKATLAGIGLGTPIGGVPGTAVGAVIGFIQGVVSYARTNPPSQMYQPRD